MTTCCCDVDCRTRRARRRRTMSGPCADDSQRHSATRQTDGASTSSHRHRLEMHEDDSGRHVRHRSSRTADEEDDRPDGDDRSSFRGNVDVDEGRVVRSVQSASVSRRRHCRALLGYVIHQVRRLTGRQSQFDDQTQSDRSTAAVTRRTLRRHATVDKRSSAMSPRSSETDTFRFKKLNAAPKTVSRSLSAVAVAVHSRQPVARRNTPRAPAGSIRLTTRSSRDGWTSVTDLELCSLRLLMFDFVHM